MKRSVKNAGSRLNASELGSGFVVISASSDSGIGRTIGGRNGERNESKRNEPSKIQMHSLRGVSSFGGIRLLQRSINAILAAFDLVDEGSGGHHR